MDDPEENPFPDGQCRLILIGKTGNGKSTTGNSILGRNAFMSQMGINSGTQYGDLQSVKKGNLEIKVMDTPGLHDTEAKDDVIAQRITCSLLAIHPGPHAVILCLSCDQRFTREEVQVFEALKEIFGENMTSYLIVVIVKRDMLEQQGVSFEQQLQECSELKNLLAQANNRYVLFDNRPLLSDEKKSEQVKQLLAKVREVVVQNGGHFRHKLSAELDNSMINMNKAEMKALDQDRTAADLHSLRSKPIILDAQKKEETGPREESEMSKMDKNKSLKYPERSKSVKEKVKHFEAGILERKLFQGDMVSKFQLKTPQDAAYKRLKQPTSERRREQSSPPQDSTGTDSKTAPEHVKHFEGLFRQQILDSESPGKPSRTQVGGAAEDTRTKAALEETRPAWHDCTALPASLVYEVPDRPGVNFRDKQRMVEEALKKKLARGTEGLNEEQIEELEKTSKSLGKKIREGMSKFAVKTIGLCRLM